MRPKLIHQFVPVASVLLRLPPCDDVAVIVHDTIGAVGEGHGSADAEGDDVRPGEGGVAVEARPLDKGKTAR